MKLESEDPLRMTFCFHASEADRVLMAAQLSRGWTAKRPNGPGWYWKSTAFGISVDHITAKGKYFREPGCQWLGPIPEPTAPPPAAEEGV